MSAILGQPVEIGAISKELKKLWEADEAATNASLMNFAVYSEQAGALEENSEAIFELTREHSCRAILVEMQRTAPVSQVEAWVTAHCHLAHGRKTVCCEQLSFRLKGKAIGRMRNTLFANLNSDLPLVFWWQGELSELFEERLYRLTNRFIVDSAEWSDVSAGFMRLSDAVADSRCQMAVQDLAWTRTYHFRLGVAGLFDDPIAQAMLSEVKTVKIAGQQGHWVSAWMMMAWLATQAEWSFQGSKKDQFIFVTQDGREVVVDWQEDDASAPLSLVSLSDGTTSVEVTRKANDPHLSLELKAPGHVVKQVTPADPDDKVGLVAEQLSRGGKNSLFRKIWPVFFEMLGMKAGSDC
ncbi:MAG: glucose-6-phosphate dehydrogenase assembly protein OpcA [Roseibacillus sp.]